MSGVPQGVPGAPSIVVTPGPEFAAIAKRLKDEGAKEIQKAMNKRIRAAADPLLKDLRKAVRAVQVKGSRGGGSAARGYHAGSGKAARKRGGGLRETVAGAIQLKIQTSGNSVGIKIRVDGTKLPDDQRGLAKLLDGQRPWRHPVFGNTSVWVAQQGQPWWTPTIEAAMPGLRTEIAKILDDVVTELDRSL